MRKLIIIGLVAAIGAVAMIQHASAGQSAEFCQANPNMPGCENMKRIQQPYQPAPGQPPGNWHKQPVQVDPWHKQPGQWGQWNKPPYGNGGWHHQGQYNGGGPSVGIYLGLDSGEPPPPPYPAYGGGYYPGQCRNIAFDLRDQGFERVRPIRCSGPRLVFSAWRDGDKVILYVNRWGRILRIIPAY